MNARESIGLTDQGGHETGGRGMHAYKENILHGDAREYPDAVSLETEMQKNVVMSKNHGFLH
ncbi:hypothetical protein [Burkholderia sp. TSV86]|uniref:hypothetical protein n=1 Tax=Burkholderia sp. TSV86 TaxID=1385594 RepID=UPI000758F354|nr:hypothetical protein [Burkholderia sp. TSV86]KVE31950.1 hypothetical protein WS68_16595 [Burkholderia sp. TSV86]